MSPAPKRDPKADPIDASLKDALVMERNGYPYLVHPLMDGIPRVTPELLQAWVDWAKAQAVVKEATLLAAPEAMGLPLVAPLALATGLPFIVIRKRKYGLPGEEVAFAETGYGESALHINDVSPADKVLLVDDVISTGHTLSAIIGTLEHLKVPVVGALVFLDKGTARRGLERTHGIPIKVQRTVKVTLAGVQPTKS